MSDAGLEVAKQMQTSTERVLLSVETAPPGTYFIAANSGRIYRVLEWIDSAQRQFKIRGWQSGADLSFVRGHPEPDGVNCIDRTHQYAEGSEVYIIGSEPVAHSEPQFLWGGELVEELEEQAVEMEELAAECEAVDEAVAEYEAGVDVGDPILSSGTTDLSESEEVVIDYAPKLDQVFGTDPATALGTVSEEQEAKISNRLQGLRVEDIPEGFLAKLPREWKSKMDWLRDVLALLEEYQFKAHTYQITEWAVRLGVWDDFDKGKGNVRSNLVELTKNEGGFRIKQNRIFPPEPRPNKPKPTPGVSLQPALAQAAEGQELSSEVIRQRLGLGVTEGAALLLVCPLRQLTPERLEKLRAALED